VRTNRFGKPMMWPDDDDDDEEEFGFMEDLEDRDGEMG